MDSLAENILNGVIEVSVVVGSRGTRERINKQRPRTKTFTLLKADIIDLIQRQGGCCGVTGISLFRFGDSDYLGPVGCVDDGVEQVSAVTIRGGAVRIKLALFTDVCWEDGLFGRLCGERYVWEPGFSREDVVRDIGDPIGWIPTFRTIRRLVPDESDRSGFMSRWVLVDEPFTMSYDNFIDKINNQLRLCHISGTRLNLRDPSKYSVIRLRNGEYMTPDNCVVVNSVFAKRWSPGLFTLFFERVSGVNLITCLKCITGSLSQFVPPTRNVYDDGYGGGKHGLVFVMNDIAGGSVLTRIRPTDRGLA